MVVLTKQQKDLISYLLTLKRDANNVVYIARDTYHYTLSEKDLLCELNFLAGEGYIEIHTLRKNQKKFGYLHRGTFIVTNFKLQRNKYSKEVYEYI